MRVESGVVETQVCPVCVLKSLLLSLKLMSIVRRVRQFDVHRLPRAPLPGPAPGPGRIDARRRGRRALVDRESDRSGVERQSVVYGTGYGRTMWKTPDLRVRPTGSASGGPEQPRYGQLAAWPVVPSLTPPLFYEYTIFFRRVRLLVFGPRLRGFGSWRCL